MTITRLILVAALAACGGKQAPPPANVGSGSGPTEPPIDNRTEIEKRRSTACESIAKKVTQCAADDARAEQAKGNITKEQLDSITAPEVLAKNTEVFIEKCDVPAMSSHQVRVLEVCHKEETECGPFLSCLDHLNDKEAK